MATGCRSRLRMWCCDRRRAASPELAAALQQFVRERLAEYKRPRGVEFVPELPKTATGKLQRFKLRAE